MRSFSTSLVLVSLVFVAASCGSNPSKPDGGTPGNGGGGEADAAAGGSGGGSAGGRGGGSSGGTPVTVTDPAAQAKTIAELRATIAADRPADVAAFQSRWPAKYLATLPYDPLKAIGLDTIAASALGISADERTLIARNGFAISARQTFPTFLHGFKGIYADHLPVYISLDSVLHAVHRSYDTALMIDRAGQLEPDADGAARQRSRQAGRGNGRAFPPEVRADVDLYLTVARRLLGTTTAAPPSRALTPRR